MDYHEEGHEIQLKRKLEVIQSLSKSIDPFKTPLKEEDKVVLESLGIYESNPIAVTNELLVLIDKTQAQLKSFTPKENYQ
jgi:hypothetical protein